MKKVLLFLVAFFIATANHASAADRFLKATVSGTVQTQALITTTDQRIHTAILNNRRIFLEYLVSPADYELVVNVSSGGEVVLLPKHTAAMLPTLSLFKLGLNNQAIINTKLGILRLVTDISAGDATNLFQDLVGEIDGSAQFRFPLSNNEIKKFTLNVTGHGTDQGGVGARAALLKFKVTAVGEFTPQP